MRAEDTSVLVVGGGVVGLSAAMFLARFDVPVLLVERRPNALDHPRARVINPRTAEIYRQAGLEPAIQAVRAQSRYSSGLVIRAETLAADERAVTRMEAAPDPERSDNITAASWIPVDQNRLESVVRARAAELGASVRFSTEMTRFGGDSEGVSATLLDLRTGQRRDVRARYLIAADGHRSGIRHQLGIPVHGPGSLGHTLCFTFEADLSDPLRGRHLAVGHFSQPRPGTSLISHSANRWVFSTPFRPEQGERLAWFTPDRCAEMARAAVGVPSLPITIVPQLTGGVDVIDYEIGAHVAGKYRDGPVFLAGDAAHVMPPAGAFGAGAGIQDAHNLAWKLAAVITGQADPGLLDTYEAERLPVARFTLGQSLHLLRERTGRHVPYAEGGAQVEYQQVIFGSRYLSGAFVAADGADQSISLPPEELAGTPGSRAPHVRVRHHGQLISVQDLFGGGLVLLCGWQDETWDAAMRRLAAADRIAADVYRFGADLEDADGRWEAAYGVTSAGAVLVRPDGIVAWRARGQADAGAGRLLERVLAECRLRPARADTDEASVRHRDAVGGR